MTVALAGLCVSCAAPRPETQLVVLDVARTGSAVRLQLRAAPGVKINARLKPTLELQSGTRITFDAERLTVDSAYFAEPPAASITGYPARIVGTLLVGVCPAGQTYCQTVTLPVDRGIPDR